MPHQPGAVHRRTEFSVTVDAPYDQVAPLFGADKERLWAEGWNPQFLHPQPPRDGTGAVFTVRGGHSDVWVNTVYDLERGHVQYACFLGDTMVTLIDIQLRRLTPTRTTAVVVYERTAVHAAANDHVNRIADEDGEQAPEWEASLRKYFEQISDA